MHLNAFFNFFAILLFKFPLIFASCSYELKYLESSLTTNNSNNDITSHLFLQDTFICNQNLNKHFEKNTKKLLTYCSDSDLDVVLKPLSVLPNGTNM